MKTVVTAVFITGMMLTGISPLKEGKQLPALTQNTALILPVNVSPADQHATPNSEPRQVLLIFN